MRKGPDCNYVLAPNAADHGSWSRSGKIKDWEIGICCFLAEHTVFKE